MGASVSLPDRDTSDSGRLSLAIDIGENESRHVSYWD
jgi:hypothetical protein